MARKISTGIGRKWKSSPSGNWKGFKVIRTGNYSSDSKRVVALEKMGKWIAAGGGAFLLVFILIVGIIAGAAFSSNSGKLRIPK